MIINGPSQLVFADGSSQQSLSLTTSGVAGTASFSVTAIPSKIVSIRKTAAGAALAVGAALTAAEAAALVATRTASGGTTSAPIQQAAVVGVKYRFFPSGGTAPKFVVGDQTAITAVHDGNFFIPNYPDNGTGTRTVDLLFDVRSAISLAQITRLVMQLNYGGGSPSNWPGVTARAVSGASESLGIHTCAVF